MIEESSETFEQNSGCLSASMQMYSNSTLVLYFCLFDVFGSFLEQICSHYLNYLQH